MAKKPEFDEEMKTIYRNYRQYNIDIKALKESFRKAMGEEVNPYEIDSLFPLSQFKIRNPCKKCIVRAMCSQECDESVKHKNIGRYFDFLMSKIKGLTFSQIVILICYCILVGILLINGFRNIDIHIKPLFPL